MRGTIEKKALRTCKIYFRIFLNFFKQSGLSVYLITVPFNCLRSRNRLPILVNHFSCLVVDRLQKVRLYFASFWLVVKFWTKSVIISLPFCILLLLQATTPSSFQPFKEWLLTSLSGNLQIWQLWLSVFGWKLTTKRILGHHSAIPLSRKAMSYSCLTIKSLSCSSMEKKGNKAVFGRTRLYLFNYSMF